MLEELKEQYRLSLPEKVKTIRALLSDLRAGNAEAQANLRLLAHSLHGSGTTFGYPAISAAARAVEHASAEAILQELANLVRVLLEASRDPPPRPEALAHPYRRRRRRHLEPNEGDARPERRSLPRHRGR